MYSERICSNQPNPGKKGKQNLQYLFDAIHVAEKFAIYKRYAMGKRIQVVLICCLY
jgi:hypothetical protein